MTQSKELQNEKLINDLYEKLHWYTFEASDEQFDAEEVDAIVQLLDVLEPMKEDPRYPSDPAAARERFNRRFGVEEDRAERLIEGVADVEGDESVKISNSMSVAGIGSGKAGIKKVWKRKNVFVRVGVGVAACLVLMLSVNVGSYALKKKSFFEVVYDEIGRTKLTVTGNEETLEDDEVIMEFSTWTEVENYLSMDLLEPEYLPPNYIIKKITLRDCGSRTILLVRYENSLSDNVLQIEVDFYEGDYSERTLVNDANWTLLQDIHDELNSQYFENNKYKSVKVIFTKDKNVYILLCQESVEELKKITESMK